MGAVVAAGADEDELAELEEAMHEIRLKLDAAAATHAHEHVDENTHELSAEAIPTEVRTSQLPHEQSAGMGWPELGIGLRPEQTESGEVQVRPVLRLELDHSRVRQLDTHVVHDNGMQQDQHRHTEERAKPGLVESEEGLGAVVVELAQPAAEEQSFSARWRNRASLLSEASLEETELSKQNAEISRLEQLRKEDARRQEVLQRARERKEQEELMRKQAEEEQKQARGLQQQKKQQAQRALREEIQHQIQHDILRQEQEEAELIREEQERVEWLKEARRKSQTRMAESLTLRRDELQAAKCAGESSTPTSDLQTKMIQVKSALGIDETTPLAHAIRLANEQLGLNGNGSMAAQAHALFSKLFGEDVDGLSHTTSPAKPSDTSPRYMNPLPHVLDYFPCEFISM